MAGRHNSRYRDDGHKASHNRRLYEVPHENIYRRDWSHDSNRRENRNRNNDVWRGNGRDNSRDSSKERLRYDKRGDCSRQEERFTRDDRQAVDRKHAQNERHGRFDRRSMDRNVNRRNTRDLNHYHEGGPRHNQGNERNNSEGRVDLKMEYKPTFSNFKYLNELQKEEPFSILMTLSNPETDLRNGLLQCFRRPHVARSLMCVLAKAFTCTTAEEKLHDVFLILKESDFINKSMAFFLDMQYEQRINEQATFRQSIMDMLTILKQMDTVENYRLSDTECKGVHDILQTVLDYLKENTIDVINDDVLNAFREFTTKRDQLTKGVKRAYNDCSIEESSFDKDPSKRRKTFQTAPSTEATQSLLSDPSEKVDNNVQGCSSSETTKLGCKHKLRCGHKCQTKSNEEHTKFCEFNVDKNFPCGHKGTVKCYKVKSALCPEPCDAILGCQHPCRGTCGECFQGRLHRPCENKCIRILVCEHECTGKCKECPPCARKCENRCQHSKCNKTCGEPCVPCKEKCTWHCEHFQCGKFCSEPCDRPRCDRPCEKKLPCGHQCIGLCGEPCPTDCRVCDKERVTEILFGNEDEPDAKFVLLEDCVAKCIVESGAMDYYMDHKDNQGKIKLKECPKCKTPIRKSNRYRMLINETLQDIERVKTKVLVNKNRVKKLEDEILLSLLMLQNKTIAQPMKRRLRSLKTPKSENTLVAMQNQILLLEKILKLEKEWKDKAYHKDLKGDLETSLNFLKRFQHWVMLERFVMTPEEFSDAMLEMSRSRALLQILLYRQKAREVGKDLDSSLEARVVEALSLLKGSKKYEEQMKNIVEACLKELKDAIPASGLGVSEEERVMIIKAFGFKKGHWYKCRNGHIYAIGECGGANQVSICPECKSEIGGERHTLREGNQVATEMDGAQFGAWSEQANMENYDPFQIRF